LEVEAIGGRSRTWVLLEAGTEILSAEAADREADAKEKGKRFDGACRHCESPLGLALKGGIARHGEKRKKSSVCDRFFSFLLGMDRRPFFPLTLPQVFPEDATQVFFLSFPPNSKE
jgi:hypothetical protein